MAEEEAAAAKSSKGKPKKGKGDGEEDELARQSEAEKQLVVLDSDYSDGEAEDGAKERPVYPETLPSHTLTQELALPTVRGEVKKVNACATSKQGTSSWNRNV